MAARAEASTKITEAQVDAACIKYGAYNCNLVHAIIWKESAYRNVTVHDVDSLSYGPGQVKCQTARLVGFRGKCSLLKRYKVGLKYTVKYVNFQLKRYGFNTRKALAAYNAGKAYTCKRMNLRKCYKGEFINEQYVWSTHRRYEWQKNKRLKTCNPSLMPCRLSATSEISQMSSKWEYLTLLVVAEESFLESSLNL